MSTAAEVDVARWIETLAAPNPAVFRYEPGDWNRWRAKHDATGSLLAAGYSREAIRALVGALCETRIAKEKAA